MATTAAAETPRTGIVDQAGVVDPSTEANLNTWLLELEKKTGAQLKVLTLSSLDGRDPYTVAIETARKWELGDKDKDNGALVLIAVKDRKWRIVTGEGIEDSIPDLYCNDVAEKYFLPYFRRNDYSTGIMMGTVALAKKIAADEGVQLTGLPALSAPPKSRRRSRGGIGACVSSFVMLLVMMSIFGSMSRRRRYYGTWGGGNLMTGMLLGSMLGGMGRGGSSWGGGFGGGGFGGGGFGGGFGGGGGGSFGGGGAGGGW